MNTVNCTVTKIIDRDIYQYNKYWVDVEYETYGQTSDYQLMFDTKEEADKVDIGYEFNA